MSRYRAKLYSYSPDYVNTKEELYEKCDVDEIFDDIEKRVKEIDDALESIKGLTEIENIKTYVSNLLKDLY